MNKKTLVVIAIIGAALSLGGIVVWAVKRAKKKRDTSDGGQAQDQQPANPYLGPSSQTGSASPPTPATQSQYPFPWREGDTGDHILALQRSINKGWDLYKLKASEAGRQVPNPKCATGKPTFPLAESGTWDACTTMAIKYISGTEGWLYLNKPRYDTLIAKLKALRDSFG